MNSIQSLPFRRFAIGTASFLLLVSCKTVEPKLADDKPVFPPLTVSSREFVESKAVLLASRVVLRLHPDLYGEIKYRIDGNFHTFRESGNPPTSRIELRNVSTVQLQPVKLWVGAIEIAATDAIDAVFDARCQGIEFDAFGSVFWNARGESTRAERLIVRDGKMQFEGRS